MQWSHLVGMVREVGVRTGIVERELSANEQARLMVTGREGTAEGGTGLTVSHERISKEEAGLGGEAIGNLAGLAHEAVLHLHGVVDAATVADNGVLANDTRSDIYRCIARRHDGTLLQAGRTVHLAVAHNDRIGNVFRIDYLDVVANESALRTLHAQLVLNKLCQPQLQLLVVSMFDHEGSQL